MERLVAKFGKQLIRQEAEMHDYTRILLVTFKQDGDLISNYRFYMLYFNKREKFLSLLERAIKISITQHSTLLTNITFERNIRKYFSIGSITIK